MPNISVTNALNDNSATSDITLVGTNFTDIVNGLSDTTKDISINNGSFAGVVKAANGTVALPGISFTNDLDSGLYRIGANNLGIATNGVKQVDIATNGLTFPNMTYVFARGSTTSCTNGGYTDVVWTTEVTDINSEFDGTVFTANLAGIYSVSWNIALTSSAWNATEWMDVVLSKNNSTSAGSAWAASKYFDAAVTEIGSTGNSAVVQLAASDTLRIKVFHNRGTATAIEGNTIGVYFMIAKIA